MPLQDNTTQCADDYSCLTVEPVPDIKAPPTAPELKVLLDGSTRTDALPWTHPHSHGDQMLPLGLLLGFLLGVVFALLFRRGC